jgi:hypothetical protein
MRAGLNVGDAVVEVGGKRVALDLEPVAALERSPTGTSVPIVAEPRPEPARPPPPGMRAQPTVPATKKVVVVLRDLQPP